jgi:membrane fusion protein
MSLFRPEVFENQRFRLHGDVMLTQSLSVPVLTGLLLSVVGMSGLWIATGQYARTEMAAGRVVPNGSLTRIVPTRAGMVAKLKVREGDVVLAGQALATILVEQASADRADPSTEWLGAIDQQHALLNEQIGLSHQGQVGDAARVSSNISQFQSQIASISEQIALQIRLVQSARDSFDPLTSGYEQRLCEQNSI